jgi:hypothetical protein
MKEQRSQFYKLAVIPLAWRLVKLRISIGPGAGRIYQLALGAVKPGTDALFTPLVESIQRRYIGES